MFFPYHFDRVAEVALRPMGVRPDRDGVRIDDDRLVATFGFLSASTELSNIAEASVTGPYSWVKAVGPRLSSADRGLTFGTTSDRGACVHFHRPIPAVVGPWKHPGLTLTVAEPEALVDALAAVMAGEES